MDRNRLVGLVAAIGMSVVLMVLDANDFAQDPPTDNADVVATLAVVTGGALWVGLRWAATTMATKAEPIELVRAIAAGIALGAMITGLASVVYDPFAN